MKTKRKKHSLKYWKDKAWKAFSAYIRQRDANLDGFTECVTCENPVPRHWKELQAGHFVDGRGNEVLYDERLVHPQCYRCNAKSPGCLAGNKISYAKFLHKKYGMSYEEIVALDSLKFKTKHMSAANHQEVYEKYRSYLGGAE